MSTYRKEGKKNISEGKRGKKLKLRRSLSTEKCLLPRKLPEDPTDPLNLKSLLDPEVNNALKADTPRVSPIHSISKRIECSTNVNIGASIIVPPQTNDPLMLTKEDVEFDKTVRLLSHPKRKRKLSKEIGDKGKQPRKSYPSQIGMSMSANQSDAIKHKKRFIYGNYDRYYGYRNNTKLMHDCRLDSWNKDWFEGKECLDIGCNVGHLTIEIGKQLKPKNIIGIDIDSSLIGRARKNLAHEHSHVKSDFPLSFEITHGPLIGAHTNKGNTFPSNVIFKQGNYIMKTFEEIEKETQLFDIILCLSLTKWVHLNWGDEGIYKLFKRIYLNLRKGGVLILEPQPFDSYKKKKNLTVTFKKNFHEIKLKPEQFNDYLLSDQIGFTSCQQLPTPSSAVQGFNRPMYLFTKA